MKLSGEPRLLLVFGFILLFLQAQFCSRFFQCLSMISLATRYRA